MPARQLGLALVAMAITAPVAHAAVLAAADRPGQGVLVRVGGDGAELPLSHTAVHGTMLGFAGHMRVQQTFNNPYQDPIEAIYVFPLPHDAAVTGITVKVGDRTIRGGIKTRAEARALYEAARDGGKTAVMLEQERPNVFTQSVANIPPGADVEVELAYDLTLRSEDGVYELVYPMVVGPRYVPGTATGEPTQGDGTAPDTDRVADGSRVTPPLRAPKSRGGHDVDVEIEIDAGLAIHDVVSPTHEVEVEPRDGKDATAVTVRLKGGSTIPNKDLVIRYRVGDEHSGGAVFAHRDGDDGWFAMMMPPLASLDEAPRSARPREVVFAIDSSASMDGEPLGLVKKAMRAALRSLSRRDHFQIVRFAEETTPLGEGFLAASKKNVDLALRWVNGLTGEGGTEVISGLRAAIQTPPSSGSGSAETDDAAAPLRMVVILTDGFAANEAEIIGELEPLLSASPDTRVFALGIGSAVNRWLLTRLAEVGRGAAAVLLLDEEPGAAAEAFFARIRAPVLVDVSLDWGSLAISDVEPAPAPDLFAGQPLLVLGRYSAAGEGTLHVRGRQANGRNKDIEVPLGLPARAAEREVLARLWARARIASLLASQVGGERADVVAAVTKLALAHGLASPYTAFVAVEERIVVKGGRRRTVVVPVEVPEGVIHDRVFDQDLLAGQVFQDELGVARGEGRDGKVAPTTLPSRPNREDRDGVSDGDGGGAETIDDAPAPEATGVTIEGRAAAGAIEEDYHWNVPAAAFETLSIAGGMAGSSDPWRFRFHAGAGALLDGVPEDTSAVGAFALAADRFVTGGNRLGLRAGLRTDLLIGADALVALGIELGLRVGVADNVDLELRGSGGGALALDGRLGAAFGVALRAPLYPDWRDLGIELHLSGLFLPHDEANDDTTSDAHDRAAAVTLGIELGF